jgi:predicted Zn-dependent peptidase
MKLLRKTLKNGMSVIMEKRALPVVAFGITNKFGASYEESKVKGISHFIEHLVFTGTKTRTHEDISREIEKKGGILNAFTSNEVTSFWFKLPSEHLFAGIDIISDMLKNPKFDIKKFEKEKKVIIEEIKMYHDDPKRHVFEKIEENLYEKPFGEGIIGNEKVISVLKRDFVVDYFKKNYSPENYIVTLVGDADFEKVCSYLDKTFRAEGRKYKPFDIKKKNGESIEERPGLDQAHFLFAIHAPLPGTKEAYALEVLDAYLANGMSSRLFLEIREERGLAYAVKSMVTAEKNYSYYGIYVGTTKKAVPEVKKIILEEFKKVKKMSEKDLKEAKERLIGLRRVGSEESASVMNDLMFNEVVSSAEDYYDYERRINEITLNDVKKIAQIGEFSSAAIVPK